MRIFSGIQPTGRKHLGNYIGAIVQYVAGQDRGEAIYCVVDLHATTVAFAPAELRELTYDTAAILLAAGGASVGVGMGQVNRVDSARLAVARAGNRAAGSVAASDAFFPFPDGFEILAEAGVRAVVEPGGSIRDDGVIAAAQAAGVTLYFTGVRHFYH